MIHYLLALNANVAQYAARDFGWSRIPFGAQRVPTFLTQKGKTVQYSNCNNLRGRNLDGVCVFLGHRWDDNSDNVRDLDWFIEWADVRGALFVSLADYSAEKCGHCAGDGCDACDGKGHNTY